MFVFVVVVFCLGFVMDSLFVLLKQIFDVCLFVIWTFSFCVFNFGSVTSSFRLPRVSRVSPMGCRICHPVGRWSHHVVVRYVLAVLYLIDVFDLVRFMSVEG